MPEPHLRAADADRTAVAEVLGTHMSAGRLTVAEYDERLNRAYAARTYGELAELTVDLPASPPAAAPVTPSGATSAAHRSAGTTVSPWQQVARHGVPACGWTGGGQRAAWASWASTAAIVLTIWLATSLASGELLYPWPIWVIGPWGAMLLAQAVTGRRDPARDLAPDTARGTDQLEQHGPPQLPWHHPAR